MHAQASAQGIADRFVHPPRQVGMFGIEPGMQIADFGAGSGAYVDLIATTLDGTGTVYAVDIQKDLLRRIASHARARGHENVRVIWGDVEEKEGTKLKDGLLDIVLVSNLLFQLSEPNAMLEEARRVLKPHGRVIIIDWEHDAPAGVRWGPHKDHAVPRARAIELLEAAGFEIMREWQAGADHYCLIALPAH